MVIKLDWKKLIKFLYPPVWLIILLTLICATALVYTFIGSYETHPFAYVTYVLASYTLTVIVMKCIKIIPRQYHTAKKKIYDNPIGSRYFTEPEFKTHVTLYRNLGVNLLYVAVNVTSGFLYHSAWFVILAFYYTILATMRFLLVRFVNNVGIGNNRFKELYRSRLCGIILLSVNLVLSATVLMILYRNKGYEYNGVLIYIMAAYTFYITSIAIINLLKYRKFGSPVMSMTKIISMAAALVSMLSLETAMFSQFGKDMSPENQRLMIALTGAGVSIVIVTMSVYSIVKNSKEINEMRRNSIYGK